MPPADAGAAFAKLVEIMARLRAPDGCPWDREQDLKSLARFVLEEAAEVVDAIERDDAEGLREEVGDLIFEGVFLGAGQQGRGRLRRDGGARDGVRRSSSAAIPTSLPAKPT